MPWRGAGERRTLFFNDAPFPLSWAAGDYNPDDYPGITEAQCLILEAPNARYQGRKVTLGKMLTKR